MGRFQFIKHQSEKRVGNWQGSESQKKKKLNHSRFNKTLKLEIDFFDEHTNKIAISKTWINTLFIVFPFIISCQWSLFFPFGAPFGCVYILNAIRMVCYVSRDVLSVQLFLTLYRFLIPCCLATRLLTFSLFFSFEKMKFSKWIRALFNVRFDMSCTRTFNKYDFSLYIRMMEKNVQQSKEKKKMYEK